MKHAILWELITVTAAGNLKPNPTDRTAPHHHHKHRGGEIPFRNIGKSGFFPKSESSS